MEPAPKKVRLTDHFRVALKPRDSNVGPFRSKQAQRKSQSQQPIEIITLGDDNNSSQPVVLESKRTQLRPLQERTKFDENKILHGPQHQQQQQQQTLPLKLGQFVANPTNHGRATKGKKNSITGCLGNSNSNNNNIRFSNNKSITSYLIKPEPSPLNKYLEPPGKASDIYDHDRTMLNNVCWEPHYAWESFKYDRQQEIKHRNTKPLFLINQNTSKTDRKRSQLEEHLFDFESDVESGNQFYTVLTPERRAELVDWLVDIQISYDLDHEPLYMAVKLVDQYLMRKRITHDNYELLFMVSMLISAKFDERVPPITIAELIRVTKTRFGIRYTRKQVVSLEADLLTTLDFDIRFPLSYGFLRRFARCTRSDTQTLYLARYILESSLMDQDMIEVIESKLAAGSLLLAFNMLDKNSAWNKTARYYTGYEEIELHPLVQNLNKMLLRLSKRKTVIRHKYSNFPYMEVAKIPINC